jgi:anaerobic magnesium-protoporphyrin IX monomethyl ester cyclase
MKVSLVRIPTIIDVSASTAPVCPPIGLAYLKAIVKLFTNDIQVIDSVGNFPKTRTVLSGEISVTLLGQTKEEIANLLSKNIDIILVSCMFSQDWDYAKQVLREIRLKCPESLIIAGGEHITALPVYSMESAPEIDACVLGEGERTLESLFKCLQDNGHIIKDLPGVCIRGGNGDIIKNGKQPRIKDLAEPPWPDWEGFPLENYFKEGHGFGVSFGGRTMPIIASRGCPYECTFCSNPLMWTTLWNVRDPVDVYNEMKLYVDKYKITNFDFYDLTAIVKKKWIVSFCKILIENKLNITWQLPSGTRSEAIDAEVAALLNKSGCRNLSYAPESGSPEILDLIKKKMSLDNMLKSMRSCVSEGLSIKVNIICGFPKERWKHLIETLKFIVQVAWVGCYDMSINQFSPYPGSELFEDLRKENKVKLDEQYFIGLSYYSSMTHAQSYSDYLSSRDILSYKLIGTASFYVVSFMRRPWRLFQTFSNVYSNTDTTRLEKTLIGYLERFKRAV